MNVLLIKVWVKILLPEESEVNDLESVQLRIKINSGSKTHSIGAIGAFLQIRTMLFFIKVTGLLFTNP